MEIVVNQRDRRLGRSRKSHRVSFSAAARGKERIWFDWPGVREGPESQAPAVSTRPRRPRRAANSRHMGEHRRLAKVSGVKAGNLPCALHVNSPLFGVTGGKEAA